MRRKKATAKAKQPTRVRTAEIRYAKHGKTIPISIRATFRGLVATERCDEEKLQNVRNNVYEKFKDTKPRNFDQWMTIMGQPTPVKSAKTKMVPDYLDIRTFADYIGVPSAILLMYTHLLGDETDAWQNQHDADTTLKESIGNFKKAVDFLYKQVHESPRSNHPYHPMMFEPVTNIGDKEFTYKANVRILEQLAECFETDTD